MKKKNAEIPRYTKYRITKKYKKYRRVRKKRRAPRREERKKDVLLAKRIRRWSLYRHE